MIKLTFFLIFYNIIDKEDFVSDGVFTPPETLVALILARPTSVASCWRTYARKSQIYDL